VVGRVATEISKEVLETGRFSEKDVIFFLSDSHNDYWRMLNRENIERPLKVFTYGSVDKPSYLPRNSIQVLFWHPEYTYADSSELNNCTFSKFYVEEFGAKPDFHAAFMFSAFQILDHFDFDRSALREVFVNRRLSINTIIGPVSWNPDGTAILRNPMYFHINHNKDVNLLSQKANGFKRCP
jgi:hypothetical protein